MAEFAVVAGLLFFLLLCGVSLMQVVQARAAVEAAAREAARYVAAHACWTGIGIAFDPSQGAVQSRAEQRARNIIEANIGRGMLPNPAAPPNVSVSFAYSPPEDLGVAGAVKATVACTIRPVASLRLGPVRPELALGPPVNVVVTESSAFRIPKQITVEEVPVI